MSAAVETTAARDTTLADVLAWAERNGESRDTLCELRKVPARLGLSEEDISLIPADVGYFEKCIAGRGYGLVSRARDLKSARQRADARIRAALQRFHAGADLRPATHREAWDRVVKFVAAREGLPARGAVFTTGKSRGLAMLRFRSRVPPHEMKQTEIDRISSELSADKRKSLRRAIVTFNGLIAKFATAPELAGLLPPTPLSPPRSADRAPRVVWESLPAPFREDVEAAMRRALARPEDMVGLARERIEAGEDAQTVLAELDATAATRGRAPSNVEAARQGWRGAVAWLVRAAEAGGLAREELTDLASLLDWPVIDSACRDQIARSQASHALKDPAKSQTLAARLTALDTLAKHGLARPDLAAHLELARRIHREYVRRPGEEMTQEARKLCDALVQKPGLAADLVRAPHTLAQRALASLDAARATGRAFQEEQALRLYAAAALLAVQLSRPVRTSNLIRLRHRGTPEAPAHLVWIRPHQHAELRYAPGEIKNDRAVTVHVTGDDAAILWTWLTEMRPRLVELRGLEDTPYVIPGRAKPRLVKHGLHLPEGCMSPSALGEMWRAAADIIGLEMTPHQARHAVATLILAAEPGNFAKAASVLGDTEDTVRKYYGRDSGAEAARQVRAALQSRHPGLLRQMRWRRPE